MKATFVVIIFRIIMEEFFTQLSGYAASLFLIISFLLKNQKRLRLINLIGCVFFVIYGFLLGNEWPIIIPNAIIACTQIYHLWIVPLKFDNPIDTNPTSDSNISKE